MLALLHKHFENDDNQIFYSRQFLIVQLCSDQGENAEIQELRLW